MSENEKAKCIMVQGTMSGAGKSLIVRGAVPHFRAGRSATPHRSKVKIWR